MIPEAEHIAKLTEKEKLVYKTSENYYMWEFLPPELFTLNDWDIIKLMVYIDPKVYKVAQCVRNILGVPVTINNWHRGGQFKYRGVRLPACKEFRRLSQHSTTEHVCRALDFSVEKHDSERIFNKLSSQTNWPVLQKAGATRFESPAYTKNWTHIDCKKVTGMKLPIIVVP